MTRPVKALTVAMVLLLVGAGVGGWLLLTPQRSSDAETDGSGESKIVEVVRRDLTVGVTVPGTLGYGTPMPVPIRASGTVTWLPATGSVIEEGQALIRVDDRPVVLLYGRTPAYRALHDATAETGTTHDAGADAGASEKDAPRGASRTEEASTGSDVEELEGALARLGYSGFTVDQTFTEQTAAAVRAWQTDLGVSPTGRVELGDVVVLPERIRVRSDASAVGWPLSDSALMQQSLTMFVSVRADGSSTDWAQAGTRVRIRLPDGRRAHGSVTRTDGAAGSIDGSEDGLATIRVRLAEGSPKTAPGDVQVTYVSEKRRGVLAVPVVALVALAEGGYGVELESGTFASVTPGLYAEGVVEVTGDVEAGTRIRVP